MIEDRANLAISKVKKIERTINNIVTDNIKSSVIVENIINYGADNSGVLSSVDALETAIAGNSDLINLPKGVYLIDKNITVPENKKIVFSRNARFKLAADITFNGTWEAGEDDWIFEFAGGVIKGDFQVSKIRPEWFGAKGDGVSDDAKAMNDAMIVCAKKRKIRLGAKNYKVRSTIVSNCRGIEGVSDYQDGSNSGTTITFDPTDKTTDLLPALLIQESGVKAVFEKFRISGTIDYAPRYLSRWIEKTKLESRTYDMFSVGAAAIEVSGNSTPIFREINTTRIKVGLLLDSIHGHVTSYDCSWNGLIGTYCRKNSEDYFFQGGGISGAFCGLMIGVVPVAGHNGGISAATISRVHMGFSPYSIYQVIDVSLEEYEGFHTVYGLNGNIEGRFEQVGEAAINLLPKSQSKGLNINGFGMTFSVIDYTDEPGRWQYSLPDDLMPANEKQKYAVWLGELRASKITNDRGIALKSKASGSLGTAFIEFLHEGNDISGLVPEMVTVKRKYPNAAVRVNTPLDVYDTIREHTNNPVVHGNLVEPENENSWTVTNGATVEIISNLDNLPVAMTEEMKRYLGESIKAVKITPNGTASPDIVIKPPVSPLVTEGERTMNLEYFIYAPSGVVANRLEFQDGKFLYNETYTGLSKTGWTHIVGREMLIPNSNFYQVTFFQASATLPTYIVGLMVSYDRPGSYSPHSHAYVNSNMELGNRNGLILTDTSTGTRYKLTVVNGAITVSPV